MTSLAPAQSKYPAWLPPLTVPGMVYKMPLPRAPQPDIAPEPLPRGQLKVSPAERWLLAGTSGTGKTTFGRELIKNLRLLWPRIPVYILDSKGDPRDFGMFAGIVEQDTAPRISWRPGDFLVWRPSHDVLDEYDTFFTRILDNKRPAIVYVDELSSICHANEAVDGYKKLVKQGRGHNICVLTATQELSYIPRQAIGQMVHFVRFNLLDEFDRRKGNRLGGRDPKGPEPRNKYGFFYTRMEGLRRPYYYDSHKRFF